jgi:hypothetical protein
MNQIKIILEYTYDDLEKSVNEFLKSMGESKKFRLNDVEYLSVPINRGEVEFSCMLVYQI